ncbi:major capsid protein [Rheinheimera phage vB_RspM_Barba22A]|jgi:hypothetical protein|uniref:Major capsid protein E n=84 Tax=root TaxID=1 RepID=A0A7G9VRY8_9CAUD|nr:major head protein [Rheinheimera phage Barba5S]YP_009822839.1 major head protein [Rheinheimera phage Barba8S]YP_009822976.1 major head protein [Rheinheimera phage vB_RspM_Barba18A]YP_009823258.1 major head protein [Rheinheimera phage Barba21A]QCQ57950.1 major capsid protein [Rheinheimera phage vB_RspM_Barba1A]QCQ58086.1 major capsid protein [Rheinheimera phage vB_RspM_Barba1S]QCQ58222.1 major capsid protein [Rheinheimera phage vB_RspM_Barba2A]QCQ58358.1 major capsid protein [Rheinheimera 
MANAISPVNFNQLVDLTTAINLIPNRYRRLGDLGLFTTEGVFQDTVVFDRTSQEIHLLGDTKGQGNKQLSSKDWEREVFSMVVPEFHYSDYLTPADVRGIRQSGSADQEEALTDIQERKLTKLRDLHEATHEYLRWGAIKGITTTPDGKVYANMFTAFGVTEKVVNFDFRASNLSGFLADCREILRHMEDNLLTAGMWAGAAHAFVSPEFFDALTTHPTTFEAYNMFVANNQVAQAQPNRDDLGRMYAGRQFYHGGVLFEEHRGGFPYNGVMQKFITATEGRAIPVGVPDLFVTYAAPALKFSYLGSRGVPTYAWQRAMENDEQVEIESFSSVLPVCKRPAALVRVTGTYS